MIQKLTNQTRLIYPFIFLGLLLFTIVFLINSNDSIETKKVSDIEQISNQYQEFLMNHPFRKSMKLSKEDRLERGLPPNKYFEQEWLYTSDPNLLRPAPEKLHQLQKELQINSTMRAPVGDPLNSWVERGPNNVGGRTHTLMFAPGSTIKVFAGGVSGGLWVNDDITNSGTVWQQVSGVPGNLAVMCITVDPNDTDIMYIGTGEVYTWGAVNGNGIYKSTDGGVNWTNIYSGGTSAADKLTYVQDIIAWNNPVTSQTEIFFGADAMAYTEEVISTSGSAGYTYLGLNTIGLYRSTDGTNFSRLTGSLYEHSAGNYYAPNDFDIGADGKLWMGTKYSYAYGGGGGILFSNDGTGWTNVRDLGTNGRVELACSKQTADKIYILAEDRVGASPIKIYRTTNAFSSSPTSLTPPSDVDTGIPADDFTRGQSFYDLMIGVDPNNDVTVYVGGIDVFKSTSSGSSWSQISKWSNNNDLAALNVPIVHADQHGIAFANSNRIIFGNDGGVFYTNDGGTNNDARNNGYNVTQFYKAAIGQDSELDRLLAGAQDNGSQMIKATTSGIEPSVEITGGDGCWAFIDQDNEYIISSYVYNNYRYITYGGNYLGNYPNASNDGDFVNQCGLDSETNNLYSNGTSGATYRIYRWNINPSDTAPTIGKTTLSNGMLNTIPTYFTASPFISDRVLVGTALGKIIRLNNASGSPSWTDISMPGTVGAVSDIRYGASEDDIMVTFHNYGVTSIWYTSNGSSGSPTWLSKEGDLPDLPVKCILQNPLDTSEVIIGTELGVWQTSNWGDANPNWVQAYNGMSDVKVLSFDFRSVDNTILAATYGRGMFTGTFDSQVSIPTTCSTTIASLNYTESFEIGLGLWSQGTGDDGQWLEDSGGTPSSNTGPSAASDGSTYLYIEASNNGNANEIGSNGVAFLEGPCLDLTTLLNVQFEFDYHSYGANLGSISLQGSINEGEWFDLFETPEVSLNSWITETVDLSSYSGIMNLRFVGKAGNGWSSDLAIDNINVYKSCNSSTSYNGIWSPSAPSVSTAITINSNYNTASNGGSFDACNITVTSNSTLTIAAGDYLKVNGNITVNAGSSLIVEHEGSVVQVDPNGLVTNNGTIIVEKITPVLADTDFTILGSPMTGETRQGVYSAAVNVRDYHTGSFVPNADVEVVSPNADNWADNNGDDWQLYSTGPLVVGAGYLVKPVANGGTGAAYTTNYTQGSLNNGTVVFNALFNTTRNDSPNMLSNPYPSAIDAIAFITDPSNSSIGGAIYFWEHLTAPNIAYPGYYTANYNMGDISYHNGIMGMAAAKGGAAPSDYIASGQGFGIKPTSAGPITFKNSHRVTGSNTDYRIKDIAIDKLYIELINERYELKSATGIGFTELATDGFDSNYDTKRLATPISIYSLNSERELGLQGRSVFNEDHVIPLGFSTQVEENQDYIISISSLEGDLITNTTVHLIDNLLGKSVNLLEEDYVFSSDVGSQTDRFVLAFAEGTLATNEAVLSESISLYPNPTHNILNIMSQIEGINTVEVYDLRGRLINTINVEGQAHYQLDMTLLDTSMYFVKIYTNDGSITKRVLKQ